MAWGVGGMGCAGCVWCVVCGVWCVVCVWEGELVIVGMLNFFTSSVMCFFGRSQDSDFLMFEIDETDGDSREPIAAAKLEVPDAYLIAHPKRG